MSDKVWDVHVPWLLFSRWGNNSVKLSAFHVCHISPFRELWLSTDLLCKLFFFTFLETLARWKMISSRKFSDFQTFYIYKWLKQYHLLYQRTFCFEAVYTCSDLPCYWCQTNVKANNSFMNDIKIIYRCVYWLFLLSFPATSKFVELKRL